MEHTPPPFFKTGPSPLARLLICLAVSLTLLVLDARFKYLDGLRQVAAVVVYPVVRLANAPINLARHIGQFFGSQSVLREENARLQQQALTNATSLLQYQALQAENANLRALLETKQRVDPQAAMAEVLYAARDPFSRKVFLDKGGQNAVKDGQPVIDRGGVVGQVTRVYPWVSEVTLITDKDHLVPVLNPRNGLRAVLAGTGNDGVLELRFVPLNADFQNGDQLVTSGIDGVYPPGLPVAQVTHVERNPGLLFARINCRPLAGVSSNTQLLIVSAAREMPDRPPDNPPPPPRTKKPRRGSAP